MEQALLLLNSAARIQTRLVYEWKTLIYIAFLLRLAAFVVQR